MAHHLDRQIASDLSYERFKHKEGARQKRASAFDNTRGTLRIMSGYHPRLFVADPDMDGGDEANPHAVFADSSIGDKR